MFLAFRRQGRQISVIQHSKFKDSLGYREISENQEREEWGRWSKEKQADIIPALRSKGRIATSLRPAWAIKTLSQITNKRDWKKMKYVCIFC